MLNIYFSVTNIIKYLFFRISLYVNDDLQYMQLWILTVKQNFFRLPK